MPKVYDDIAFHDYVVAHGLGPPSPDGERVGRMLIEDYGDDYATAAFEVVARGLTVESEVDDDEIHI